MYSVGIDIGTTNIELVLFDFDTFKIVEHYSEPNVRIKNESQFVYQQDPKKILDAVRKMLSKVTYPISSLGISGQVHGILYTDQNGEAISPLYTWLDRQSEIPVEGKSSQQLFEDISNYRLDIGYGALTHFDNRLKGKVPANAKYIIDINTFVAENLINKRTLLSDSSLLASFGIYDTISGNVLSEVLNASVYSQKLNPIDTVRPSFYGLAQSFSIAGFYNGIPVAYPVGDNQAGFLAAVASPSDECLINIGTSGQISLLSDSCLTSPRMELRPYFDKGYLHVGATLCAGKAYEVLASFIREVFITGMKVYGHDVSNEVSYESVFNYMREMVSNQVDIDKELIFETSINGVRGEPYKRGSISNIGIDNFTVSGLIRSCIDGIVTELNGFQIDCAQEFKKIDKIVVIGNMIEKTPYLFDSLEVHFHRNIRVRTASKTALGAALVGAISAGIVKYDDLNEIIKAVNSEK